MKLKKIVVFLFILTFIITGMRSVSFAGNFEDPGIIRNRAEEWLNIGENNPTLNTNPATTRLQELAGLIWGIGIFIAVAVGMILGIKFMLSTPSGKAEVSKLVTPYIVGVAVVVGALTIWRVVINILDV